MTNIWVTNLSTEVTDTQAQTMTRAVAYQIRMHAAPLWQTLPVPVQFVPKAVLDSAPPGAWVIALVDDADQADDLGWHVEDEGEHIYGRVFVRPILDNGGDTLTKKLSVASTLSHEALETLIDPHVNLWANAGNGRAFAYEICDPVEALTYPVDIDGTKVTVANFVTPAWFDPKAGHPQFDYLGKCTQPFTVAPGGYAMELTAGEIHEHYGEHYPPWRKATKTADTSRSQRRRATNGVPSRNPRSQRK
jgi:hypothetical protein